MGRHSAERNLTTIYRLFFRISSVRFVIERAPRLYSMHYDTGELKVATQSENHVLLQLEHVDEPNCAHCASIQGWAAKAIELSGGKLRETTRGRCRRNGATGCEFSFRWD
jgi:hypothetical protein